MQGEGSPGTLRLGPGALGDIPGEAAARPASRARTLTFRRLQSLRPRRPGRERERERDPRCPRSRAPSRRRKTRRRAWAASRRSRGCRSYSAPGAWLSPRPCCCWSYSCAPGAPGKRPGHACVVGLATARDRDGPAGPLQASRRGEAQLAGGAYIFGGRVQRQRLPGPFARASEFVCKRCAAPV